MYLPTNYFEVWINNRDLGIPLPLWRLKYSIGPERLKAQTTNSVNSGLLKQSISHFLNQHSRSIFKRNPYSRYWWYKSSIVQPWFNTHSKTFEIIPLLPQPFMKIMQHVLLNLHQFQKNHPGLNTLHYLITSFDPKLKHSKLLSLQLEQTISPLYVLFTTVLKVYIDYGRHPCNCEPYNALCDIQTDLYLWIFSYA